MIESFRGRRRVLLSAALLGVAPALRAQAWPSRPVRIVVGFAAGGGVDAMARLLAARLAELTKQQFIVENRAGASGLIAADAVSRAAPDGHTLLLGDTSLLIARSLKIAQAPDAFEAFTPVAAAFRAPLMIVGNNEFPATNPAELVRALRAAPGKYSYATSGVGTVHHLGFEMLKQRTGTFAVHIPYRGASQIVPDVVGGQVPLGVVSATAGIASARAGRLRALAMMSNDRMPGFESVAPLSAAVPGLDVAPSLFVLAPPALPAEIVARLGDALRQALSTPDAGKAALAQGAVVTWRDASGLADTMRRETTSFAQVIRQQGITADGS